MGEAAADDLDDYSVSTTGQRPASEEAEIKLARSHPLYNAKPGKDDFFHCPFEGQQGCNHRAIKLKCNYDKYVDSHLKPFRCKINSCIDLRFSSTACLLRHEREAHGMHGHGSKPHLCSYPDCERSIPGHGFPRRYNLYDHMKRVHDFVDESSLPVSSSSTSAAQTNPALVQSRKRKNVAPAEELHGKRTKSGATAKEQLSAAPTNMPPPSQSRREEEQRRQERIVQWTNSRDVVIAHLQSLNRPEDVQANMQRQISGAMADFFKITSEIHGAG
ncbi:hypothetical protein BDY21DRAFT_277692 [Lineolata rhizophorae]|uniref:C2H2-type domain-containing protein n=1 Tax=Lineolata rhizophorae TaxID=578093 RepID=A0A6A6PER5_9PEZI|nr:hypothetical protein BDY21DRAFT_277692 [Lineolata rhizophorae]